MQKTVNVFVQIKMNIDVITDNSIDDISLVQRELNAINDIITEHNIDSCIQISSSILVNNVDSSDIVEW